MVVGLAIHLNSCLKSATSTGSKSGVDESAGALQRQDMQCKPYKTTNYQTVAWDMWLMATGFQRLKRKSRLLQIRPVSQCGFVTPHFQAYAGGVFNEKVKLRVQQTLTTLLQL